MNITKSLDSLIGQVRHKPIKSKVRDSKYILFEKSQPLPVSNLNNMSGHIPENAVTYSYINIGKKNMPDFQKTVITFNDKDDQVIRKIFVGTGMTSKIRDYEKNVYAKDGWNEFLEHRHIKTKEVTPDGNGWQPVQEEDQYIHLSTTKYKYKRGFARKLHINKNEYHHDNGQNKIVATITEYPYNMGFQNIKDKKVMEVEMSIKNNRPHIDDVLPSTNVELPKNDEYLPYRFLLGEQKQTSITQKVLDDKGVGNLGVGIYYSKDIVPKNSEGMFNHFDGNIYYRDVSKSHPVKIAGHEGEHVYQYSLIGRLGKLLSKFGIICKTHLPSVTDIKEMDKGYKCVIAAEKYPKLSETENLKNNLDYWENGLEVGARLSADEITKSYDEGRQVLIKEFPYAKGETVF